MSHITQVAIWIDGCLLVILKTFWVSTAMAANKAPYSNAISGAMGVWAHLGEVVFPERSKRYGPEFVGSLIQRFPNLHFDLGGVVFPAFQHPANNSFFHRTHTLYGFTGKQPYDGYLRPKWRDLMAQHPEHFLIAIDMDSTRWRNFLPNVVDRFRYLVLRELDERAQHLLAYRNAWRLITGETWK
jgi:hypothetical protein